MANINECAKFHLNTSVFGAYTSNTAVTNQYGTCDAQKANCTFNNIPIQLILGPMYAKYDKFNLVVSSLFIFCPAAGYLLGTASADRFNTLEIGGLPFVDNYSSNGLTQTSNIGGLYVGNVVNTLNINSYNFVDQPMTFIKNNQPYINLSVNFLRADGGVIARNNTDYCYEITFSIYGIKD